MKSPCFILTIPFAIIRRQGTAKRPRRREFLPFQTARVILPRQTRAKNSGALDQKGVCGIRSQVPPPLSLSRSTLAPGILDGSHRPTLHNDEENTTPPAVPEWRSERSFLDEEEEDKQWNTVIDITGHEMIGGDIRRKTD